MSRYMAVVVVVVVGLVGSAVGGTYGGGAGEPNDPYQIWDANHMQAIGADANDWAKHFVLMADIDLAQYDGKDGREKFNMIGDWLAEKPFSGVFDGNDHAISNFTHEANDVPIGLFGYVSNGEIRNLGLIDPNVDGRGEDVAVGSLVGFVDSGTVSGCYAEGVRVTGPELVGGLVGYNNFGIISNCYSTGDVNGSTEVGGLVGASEGTITECYTTSCVTGHNRVGGLVGDIWWGFVTNCYATGSVDGNDLVGGLVGDNRFGNVTHTYATCNVTGNEDVGGLVGSSSCIFSDCSTITNSYWDIQISGRSNMCGSQDEHSTGCDPNYGKTTAEMKHQSTFTDWDFINVWNIGENQTYPYLRTVPAGDINKDGIVNFLDVAVTADQWMNEE